MNKETDDIFELRAEFLAEAAESMVELDVDLVSLQNDPGNAALLDRVFRLVHTIKGAAGLHMGTQGLTVILDVDKTLLSLTPSPARAAPLRQVAIR